NEVIARGRIGGSSKYLPSEDGELFIEGLPYESCTSGHCVAIGEVFLNYASGEVALENIAAVIVPGTDIIKFKLKPLDSSPFLTLFDIFPQMEGGAEANFRISFNISYYAE